MRVLLKDTDKATLYCDWLSVQDISNNESIITLSMVVVPKTTIGSWTDFNGSYLGTKQMTFTGTIPKISNERTIVTKTMTVEHDSDGEKEQLIYWKWGVNSPWGGFENPSGSIKIKLPTIERATKPKISAYEQFCGKTVIISTPRVSSSFKHKITYITNDKITGTIASDVDTSYTWTIPFSLCNKMPDSTAMIVTIKCQTLKGTTVVGEHSVKLTVKVPDSVIPTISSISTTETNENNKLGAFVQNKTRLNVAIDCMGAYGSVIQSITTKINGAIYKGDVFTSKLLNENGELDITTSIIDSRGRKATKTIKIDVLPYFSPRITLFNAERCNSDGTLNDSGEFVKITYKYAIAPLDGMNEKNVVIEYEDSGSYTTLKTINEYSQNSFFITAQKFDINKTYKARIKINDIFAERESLDDILSEQVIVDIKANGKGLAFGKVSEKDETIETGWDIEEKDSAEWTDLNLESTFKAYDSDQTPVYKCKGRIVEINGAVSPLTAFTSNATRVRFGSLPVKYAPPKPIYISCQGSGKNTWLLSILTTGELTISRYGNTEYTTVETTAWLTFHATYFIKN